MLKLAKAKMMRILRHQQEEVLSLRATSMTPIEIEESFFIRECIYTKQQAKAYLVRNTSYAI
jgi:hypothetical protein